MSDTSGHMYATPFAQYDQDTRSWRTSAATSLWALPMSSLTLPKSGGLVNGELIERPMLEPPTVENASSSLLATPTTMDDLPAREGEAYESAKNSGGRKNRQATGNLREQVIHSLPTPHAGLGERGRDGVYPNPKGQQDLQHTLATLLPTPAVMDMGSNYTPEEWQAWKDKQRAAHNNGNGHGASLTQEALSLLPTPNTMDGMGERSPEALARAKTKGGCSNLKDVIPTLLPTPKATNNENQQNLADYGPNLGMALMPDQYDWSVAGRLLPTPEVRLMGTPTAAMSVRSKKFKRSAQNPAEFAESMQDKLLPTPTVIDSKGPVSMQRNQMDKLRDVTWLLQTGESTPPQSDDGKLF